jgi:hypothetical protein
MAKAARDKFGVESGLARSPLYICMSTVQPRVRVQRFVIAVLVPDFILLGTYVSGTQVSLVLLVSDVVVGVLVRSLGG